MNCRRLSLAAWVALSLWTGRTVWAQEGQGELLKLLPSDAALCVWASNPDALAAKGHALVAEIAAAVGEAPPPQKGLAALLAKGPGIQDGFDAAKPAALVVPKADFSEGIIIVGLRDLDAMLTGRERNDLGGGIIEATVEGGKPLYLVRKRDFVMIAPSSELLLSALAPKATLAELSAETAALHAEGDLSVRVNVEALRTKIDQGFQMLKGMMQMVALMSGAAQGGGDPAVTMAIMDVYVGALKSFIDQVQTVDAVLRLEAEGVGMGWVCSLKPDGTGAAYLAKQKPAGKPLLRGLPSGPFMMVFGGEWQSADQTSLAVDLLDRFLAAPAVQQKLGESVIEAMRDSAGWFYRNMTGFNATVARGGPQGGMRILGQYFLSDPQTGRRKMAEMMASTSEMMGIFIQGLAVTSQPAVRTVGELEVDEYAYKFDQMPDAERQMLEMMYGKGASMQIAAVKDSLLMAMSPDSTAIESMAALVDKPAAGLGDQERVKAALAKLPADRVAVALVDVPEAMRFALSFVAQMGMPTSMPAERASTSPPVASSLSFVSSGLRCEVYVPTAAIKELVSMAAEMTAGMTAPGATTAPSGEGAATTRPTPEF
ncbi:MAG TPA: hypothetical protein VMZ31_20600 [Phycisphaerae bacterium]|nr:hypothetical protein [Phycisphaerae bacterium]